MKKGYFFELNKKEDLDLLLSFECGEVENLKISKVTEILKVICNFLVNKHKHMSHQEIELVLNKTDAILSSLENLSSVEIKDLKSLLQISWYGVFLHDCRLKLYGLNEDGVLRCRVSPVLEQALVVMEAHNTLQEP